LACAILDSPSGRELLHPALPGLVINGNRWQTRVQEIWARPGAQPPAGFPSQQLEAISARERHVPGAGTGRGELAPAEVTCCSLIRAGTTYSHAR